MCSRVLIGNFHAQISSKKNKKKQKKHVLSYIFLSNHIKGDIIWRSLSELVEDPHVIKDSSVNTYHGCTLGSNNMSCILIINDKDEYVAFSF